MIHHNLLKNLTNLKSESDKLNIDNLKCKVDKLFVDKLVHITVDLRKLSDAVKNDVLKGNAQIKNIDHKIPDITNLATNTTLNAKRKEAKKEIPNVTNLATAIALSAVENEIPNISNLIKKQAITQNLVKFKTRLLLIMIMINILLFKNLIS